MLQQPAEAASPPVAAIAPPSVHTYRFLLVDDDPFVSMVLQALVLDQERPTLKLEVSCCATRTECLEQLEESAFAVQPFDVMLLDYDLDDDVQDGGLEVLDTIRGTDEAGTPTYPWLSGMRIIMMSGEEIEDQDAIRTALRVESFLLKPVTARQLASIIDAWVMPAAAEPAS